jgi:hypothetical protein
MPLVFVPSTQPTRILKAVSLLVLTNVFLGGALGFGVCYLVPAIQNSVLFAMGAGVAVAELGTFLVVRALFLRGRRAVAPRAFPLGDFLDDMLITLLGVLGGIPMGVGILASCYGNLGRMPWHSNDWLEFTFGALSFALGVRSAMQLAAFVRATAS